MVGSPSTDRLTLAEAEAAIDRKLPPRVTLRITSFSEYPGNPAFVNIGGWLVAETTGYALCIIPVPKAQAESYRLGQEIHVIVQAVIS